MQMNVCRSPMAEYVMKHLVKEAGRDGEFLITSGAVSREEIGNGIYPETKECLYRKGIPFNNHRSHQITVAEFDANDLIVVMDRSNISLLTRIVGEDKVYDSGKVHLLMEYASATAGGSQFDYPSVADPWYTRDFEKSYQDILAGCKGLLEKLVI